jgi:hypothetical protein
MTSTYSAKRIPDSNDYSYRGVRVYVRRGQYRGQTGAYFVQDFEPRDQFGRRKPKVMLSSLAKAKAYIDRGLAEEAKP